MADNTQKWHYKRPHARCPERKIFMKMDLLFYQIQPIRGWNEKIPPRLMIQPLTSMQNWLSDYLPWNFFIQIFFSIKNSFNQQNSAALKDKLKTVKKTLMTILIINCNVKSPKTNLLYTLVEELIKTLL